MSSLNFNEKKVLVVGGSSGIGNGIARAFQSSGGQVCVWGTRSSADEYDDEEGSNLSGLDYVQVDVSDPQAITEAEVPFDGLDILILCQGIVFYDREEFAQTAWDKVMAVNLDSLIHICEKYKSQLAASNGAIVIISSVSGLSGNVGNPAYAASKAGAISLTKSLGQAYASSGIRVNGVAPGLVDTKLTKVTTQNQTRLEATLKMIPQRRMGLPEDIAGSVLFLASPLASYVCGHTIVVDGGLTL